MYCYVLIYLFAKTLRPPIAGPGCFQAENNLSLSRFLSLYKIASTFTAFLQTFSLTLSGWVWANFLLTHQIIPSEQRYQWILSSERMMTYDIIHD